MWVKFHDHRRQGFWTGVPRATRFVLLELELLCRPGEGRVELPPGKDPIGRTLDMLGGNRREARKALRFLTADGCKAVLYRASDGSLIDPTSTCACRLMVVVPSWAGDNSVTSSAQRMRNMRAKRKENRGVAKKCDASPASPRDASRDDLEKRREEKRRSPTSLGDARARDDQPPPQGPDQPRDERQASEGVVCEGCDGVGQTETPRGEPTGWLDGLCPKCQSAERPPEHEAGQRRPRREHPRERGYTNDLLSPEAKQIHELLLQHRLPLNSPTGAANHIAGRLGMGGNNKLTVPRVRIAVEAVADKCAFAAADGAPRTTEEVWDHLQSFLRYTDARWKALEKKLADDGEGPSPDAPPYHAPAPEHDVPPGFKPAKPPPDFKAAIARFGLGGAGTGGRQ